MFIGYGGDSSNYLMMGKMLLAGKVPYLDFFDHKGPVITFVEALGQSIAPDRLGLFILQIINLTLTLSIIYCCARLILSKSYSFLTTVIALFFFTFTMEGGNLTEEYSLPFLFYTLYVTLKFYFSGNKKLNSFHLVLTGICAAFLFWLRLNNMGALCACMLYMFIVSISDKNWRLVKNIVIFFIIGFILGSAPVVIYFWTTNSFMPMIDAAFIHNFKYLGTDGGLPSPFVNATSTFFYILKAWVPFIVLFIGTSLYYLSAKRDKNALLFAFLLFFFGYITTHIGSAYYHYMTLNIPSLTTGCIFFFIVLSKRKSRNGFAVTFSVILFLGLIAFSAFRYIKNGGGSEGDSYYISQAREMTSLVPEDEKNSVFGYHTYSRFYPSGDVLPCFKYYIMQEWMGRSNPQIIAEINDMMETNPPKWVFTEFRSQSTNLRFWEIIDQKYELRGKNNLFEAYHLKQ
ncbi:hypothetical protein D0T56_00260 [Dysgonomonas sp. 520]|nr:hypothetical protein [Dysgonomonas sp. 520]